MLLTILLAILATLTSSLAAASPLEARAGTASIQCTVTDTTYDYRCPVVLGGQTFNLQPDTGTDTTWVAGPTIPAANCTGYTVYHPTSTFVKTGAEFSGGYPTGFHIDGDIGQDYMSLGSMGPRAEFAVATAMISTDAGSADGILGLAYSANNGLTLLDSIKSDLALPLFTLAFTVTDGTIGFGAIDPQYTSQVAYSPVVEQFVFWGFNVPGYQVGANGYQATGWNTIIDSGSYWTFVPTPVANDYYAHTPTAVWFCNTPTYCFWVVECSATMPDFAVQAGGKLIWIAGGHLMGGSTVGPAGRSNCIPVILGRDVSSNNFILGKSFLWHAYVVFDRGNSRIGFAQR